MGGLSGLVDLLLSHNSLRELPIELAELASLKKLHVDGNPLVHLPPALRPMVGDESELSMQLSTSLFGDEEGGGG